MGFRGRRGGSPGAALHEQTVVFAWRLSPSYNSLLLELRGRRVSG